MHNFDGEWIGGSLDGRLDWVTWAVADPLRLSAVPLSVWWSHHPPDDEIRLKCGQLLKPGRVAELTGKSVDAVLAVIARRTAIEGLSSRVQVGLASEVYCLPHSSHGAIGSSCMRPNSNYTCPRAAFEFYDLVGAQVAYVLRDGRVVARAVVYGGVYSRAYAEDQGLSDAFCAALGSLGYSPMDRDCFVWPADAVRGYLGPVPYVDWCGRLCEDKEGRLWLAADSGDSLGVCRERLDTTDGSSTFFQVASPPKCYECGCGLTEEDMYSHGGHEYCPDCFYDLHFFCSCCDEACPADDAIFIADVDETWCRYCADRHAHVCPDCGEYYRSTDSGSVNSDDDWICQDCLTRNYTYCVECGEYFSAGVVEVQGLSLCESCRGDLGVFVCQTCGELFVGDDKFRYRRWTRTHMVCSSCLPDTAVQCDDCEIYVHVVDADGLCADCAQKNTQRAAI